MSKDINKLWRSLDVNRINLRILQRSIKGRKEKGRNIGSQRKVARVREIEIDRIGKIGEEIEICNINQNKKTGIEEIEETEIGNVVREIKIMLNNVRNKRSSMRNLVDIRIKVMLRKTKVVKNLSMILLIVLRILLILLVHSNLMIERESMRRKESAQRVRTSDERTKRRTRFATREKNRKRIRIKIVKRISIRQRR